MSTSKDFARHFSAPAGRRHTDRSGLWYFACGFGWALVIVVIVGGIA